MPKVKDPIKIGTGRKNEKKNALTGYFTYLGKCKIKLLQTGAKIKL